MHSTGFYRRSRPFTSFSTAPAAWRCSSNGPLIGDWGFRHSAINDGDGIRTLRAALKILLRRFGLRAIKVEQTTDNDRA